MAKTASRDFNPEYFFELRQNPVSQEWAIVAPQRSKRPDILGGERKKCPFCSGNEKVDFKEIIRLGKGKGKEKGWQIRIIPNKFPFAPIHELVIHTPIHAENFFTFDLDKTYSIFRLYRDRYLEHEHAGQVYTFHNHGLAAGESIPHSHTQIAVLPKNFTLEIPMLGVEENIFQISEHFQLFCPCSSSWPWEVWIAPKERNKTFGETRNEEIRDLARVFSQTLRKMRKHLGLDFPFNFYIYPGSDWYLRIVPRKKSLGGFEVGTGIFINTSDPETVAKKLS